MATTPFLTSLPNEEQFGLLFKEYYSRLTFFVHSIIFNSTAAEDIVQDCFVKLWERKSEIDWTLSIGPYLYGMVRFSAYHYLRDQKITDPIDFEKDIPDDSSMLIHLIETETMHEIYQAIQTLPPKCGDIFSALFLQGKSIQEIAVEHQLSPSTVRSHKAAALTFLRRRIELMIAGLFIFLN